MKWQAETTVPEFGHEDIEVEDGGQAIIYGVYDDPDIEEGMWVHLRSWKNLASRITGDAGALKEAHPDFAQFVGKRIRVTVEVIDD